MKYRKNFLKYAEVDIEELCFGLGTGSTQINSNFYSDGPPKYYQALTGS